MALSIQPSREAIYPTRWQYSINHQVCKARAKLVVQVTVALCVSPAPQAVEEQIKLARATLGNQAPDGNRTSDPLE
jgi:hypothetical protein